MIFNSMHELIGRTPLVRLRVNAPEGVEVFAKLEMHNPFGMKDRAARNIIMSARATGVLRPGAPIVESSSGSMALGVALVGRALGHEVHIVTDPRIDRVTMAKLRAFGCELHVVSEMSGQGWQSARLEHLERLMQDLPGAFWPQQYSNPDNPSSYRTLADEVLQDLGAIDVLVGSVGSGGSLCGSARAFRRTLPDLWVVGVDCIGSVLFGQPDMPRRLQSGLGNSLLPKNLDHRLINEVHWLNDREAFESTEALALEQQIFAGNTSGSVYRVLRDTAARARPGDRIVGIFPDRGDRYAETVHNRDYWAEHGLDSLPSTGVPTLIDYGAPAKAWSRAKMVVDDPRYMLFIEANTSGTGMLAMQSARDLGLLPVLLTNEPARYAGLAETGCQVLTCDTASVAMLHKAIRDGFRREEIAGLTTTSDFYVPMAAGLAEWLGLPANPAKSVALCRDKAELRETLALANIHQPRFTVVTDSTGPVDQVGFPCVVKPSDDSGSTNVMLCDDARQARAQARRIVDIRTNVRGLPTARTALVEQFLDGPEFSVEMFGWNGRTECVGITAKQVGELPYFVETGHLFPADLPPQMTASIVDVVRSALVVCDMRLGPSHTEVRLTKDGPAIIEINPRLAGGMIPELVRLTTGVNLLEQQLRVAAGLPPVLNVQPSGYAGIRFLLAEQEGVLTEIDGVANAWQLPGIEQVTLTAKKGTQVRPPRNAYDRLGYVIARGNSPEEVTETLDMAAKEIRMTVV